MTVWLHPEVKLDLPFLTPLKCRSQRFVLGLWANTRVFVFSPVVMKAARPLLQTWKMKAKRLPRYFKCCVMFCRPFFTMNKHIGIHGSIFGNCLRVSMRHAAQKVFATNGVMDAIIKSPTDTY